MIFSMQQPLTTEEKNQLDKLFGAKEADKQRISAIVRYFYDEDDFDFFVKYVGLMEDVFLMYNNNASQETIEQKKDEFRKKAQEEAFEILCGLKLYKFLFDGEKPSFEHFSFAYNAMEIASVEDKPYKQVIFNAEIVYQMIITADRLLKSAVRSIFLEKDPDYLVSDLDWIRQYGEELKTIDFSDRQ